MVEGSTQAASDRAAASVPHSPEARYAGRVGKHAAIYGVVGLMTLVSGLISLTVFTRFLDPTAYGKVAVLMTTASFVTVLVNLGSLQGTMRRVHGAGGDEDGGEEAIDLSVTASDPRLALTTGLVLTTAIGFAVFLIAFAVRRQLASVFFGAPDESALFVLTVGAGCTAATMRLARNILRLQLRSVAYLVVSTVFALGSTLVAIPLLVGGLGVSAVLIGAMAGSGSAAILAVAMLRRDVGAAVSLQEAREIMRSGLGYLPLILSFQTLQLADTYLVAGFADLSSAGLYGVAKKVAQPVTYGTSVFQQAWAPMSKDPTHRAVESKDENLAITARLVTIYSVFMITIILGIAIFSDQLVRLASSEYQEASLLVPLTALSIAGHGSFVLAYRISKLASKFFWMNLLAVIAAPVFVGIGSLLIIPFGAVGAPIAAIAAWSLTTVGMVALSQAKGQKVPYERWRLLQIAATAGAVWTIGYYVLPDTPLGVAGKGLLFAAWLTHLVYTDVIPREGIVSLFRFARYASATETKRSFRRRLRGLEGRDRVLVDEVIRGRVPIERVAKQQGLDESKVLALTVQALRRAATGGEPKPTDAALGRAILIPRATAEEHHLLVELTGEGADPIDTDLIIRTAVAARGRRGRLRRSA